MKKSSTYVWQMSVRYVSDSADGEGTGAQCRQHNGIEFTDSVRAAPLSGWKKAVKLRDEGKKAADIVAALKESMAHEHSFLIPQDYSFLKRGGRLKPAAASIGGLLKLKPVMHAVEDGSRLDKFTITRTLSKAADSIISYFREHGVDAAYRISVSHADALADARFFIDRLKNAFPDTELELLKLSPAFITQGGPAVYCSSVYSQIEWEHSIFV